MNIKPIFKENKTVQLKIIILKNSCQNIFDEVYLIFSYLIFLSLIWFSSFISFASNDCMINHSENGNAVFF